MNLYETVKAAVPLRAAADRYGLQQNWSGMTRCLFHEDHTPSMKLNDDYFYCFGCGTHGDVIGCFPTEKKLNENRDAHSAFSLPKRTPSPFKTLVNETEVSLKSSCRSDNVFINVCIC